MNRTICALCEQELAPDSRSVLCPACVEANRARVKRMVAFDDVWGEMHRLMARVTELRIAYPDAAPMVEELGGVLARTYPAIGYVRAQLHLADSEIDARLTAAHVRRGNSHGQTQ